MEYFKDNSDEFQSILHKEVKKFTQNTLEKVNQLQEKYLNQNYYKQVLLKEIEFLENLVEFKQYWDEKPRFNKVYYSSMEIFNFEQLLEDKKPQIKQFKLYIKFLSKHLDNLAEKNSNAYLLNEIKNFKTESRKLVKSYIFRNWQEDEEKFESRYEKILIGFNILKNEITCPITMEKLEVDNYTVTTCDHVFNSEALKVWRNNGNKTCPL